MQQDAQIQVFVRPQHERGPLRQSRGVKEGELVAEASQRVDRYFEVKKVKRGLVVLKEVRSE